MFIIFSFQLQNWEPSKYWFFLGKNHVFSKNRFSILTSIFINFWPNLGPFFLQKSFKIKWKRDLKKHQKIVRFLNRFGLRFGGARGCIFRALFVRFSTGSRWNRARSASRCSTFHEIFSKNASNTFKIDFASILGRFFHDVGSVLGATWVDFCKHSCIITTLSSLTLIDHNEATDCNNKRLRKTHPRVEGVGGCNGSI